MTVTEMIPEQQLADALDHFGYLWERWQDEKEFEDFQEYVNSMASKLPTTATNIVMQKRPWKLTFVLNGQKCYMKRIGNSIEYGTLNPK